MIASRYFTPEYVLRVARPLRGWLRVRGSDPWRITGNNATVAGICIFINPQFLAVASASPLGPGDAVRSCEFPATHDHALSSFRWATPKDILHRLRQRTSITTAPDRTVTVQQALQPPAFFDILVLGCDNQNTRRRLAMSTGSESVIVRDPEILSGQPVFRGTRVPFQALLDYLEGGDTLDEFLEQYPGVTREQAIAALEEAKALVLARFEK